MTSLEKFADQIIKLAWIKGLLSEDFPFINKFDESRERREMIIFQNFEAQTGAFDLPAAEVRPVVMERSIYEVVGQFMLTNKNNDIQLMLQAPELKSLLLQKISQIKEKGKQFLRGSPIEDN